ncbi:MAG: HEAT repeat domain-containing protein [Salinibacter sp.]
MASLFSGWGFGDNGVLWAIVVACGVFTLLSLAMATTAVVAHLVSKRRARTRKRDKAAWRRLLLDILAGDAPPEALSNRVEMANRHRFLSFLVSYAITIRGREHQTLREVARPFLPSVERDLQDRSPMIRAQAVQRLGLLGDSETHAPLLRDALDDPSQFVGGVAFRHLAKWSDPDDVPLLLEAVRRLSRADRTQLVASLVELGENAAPFLRTALADDERTRFEREVCAETLRWLGDVDAASVAADLLATTDPPPELTAALLRLLRRVGGTRHASIVRPYCDDEVPFVRIQAARALGQLGESSDGALLAERVRTDPSRWVALSAAQSLAELGRTDQLRQLRDAASDRGPIAADLLPAPA